MKNSLHLTLVRLLVLASAIATWPVRIAAAEPAPLPSIFVAPIDNGMNQALSIWQPALGEGLAEMLITELTKLRKFRVLESTALDSLREEMKIGDEGWVKLDEKVDKGDWAGADYMFRGKITRYSESEQKVGSHGIIRLPFNVGVTTRKAEIQIDWRIVDVARRTIVKSGQATGKKEGASFQFAGRHGGGSLDMSELRESAFGKATMDALQKIVADVRQAEVTTSGRQLAIDQKAERLHKEELTRQMAVRQTPGVVTGVSTAGFVFISLGTKHGLKKGDKVQYFELVEDKDASGKILFTEERLAGELILDSVTEEKSKATCLGTVPPKEGWSVKAL